MFTSAWGGHPLSSRVPTFQEHTLTKNRRLATGLAAAGLIAAPLLMATDAEAATPAPLTQSSSPTSPSDESPASDSEPETGPTPTAAGSVPTIKTKLGATQTAESSITIVEHPATADPGFPVNVKAQLSGFDEGSLYVNAQVRDSSGVWKDSGNTTVASDPLGTVDVLIPVTFVNHGDNTVRFTVGQNPVSRISQQVTVNVTENYQPGAQLVHANLAGLDLTGRHLENVNLTDANLHDTVLSGARLDGATLTRTDFTGANLQGAWFSNAHGTTSTVFTGAHLQRAQLNDIDLSGQNFSGQDLTQAMFHRATVYDTKFTGTTLTDVQFMDGRMNRGTNFDRATLQGTWFVRVDLTGQDFSNRDLIGVNFDGATLVRADFTGSRVQAFLGYADMTGAVVERTAFDNSWFLSTTLTKVHFTGLDMSKVRAGWGYCKETVNTGGQLVPDGRCDVPFHS